MENGIRLSLIDHAKAADEPGEVHHDRAGLCDVAGPSDRGIDQHSPVYRLNNQLPDGVVNDAGSDNDDVDGTGSIAAGAWTSRLVILRRPPRSSAVP